MRYTPSFVGGTGQFVQFEMDSEIVPDAPIDSANRCIANLQVTTITGASESGSTPARGDVTKKRLLTSGMGQKSPVSLC